MTEARMRRIDIVVWIDRAIDDLNLLSKTAKAEGDLPTMYAANRAWRELYEARDDLEKRRLAKRGIENGC